MFLITLEGLPKSGKQTQINLLSQDPWFKSYSINTYIGSDPGSFDPLSAMIEHLRQSKYLNPREKLFLQLTGKSMQYKKFQEAPPRSVVLLKNGVDATMAYQGFAQNVASISFLREACGIAIGALPPSLTIYLDLPVEASLKRKNEDQSINGYPHQYYSKVAFGYREIIKNSPGRFLVVDATRSVEEVSSVISQNVKTRVINYLDSMNIPF